MAASEKVSWAALPPKAKAWRVAHATWSAVELACLGYVWLSALTGRRDTILGACLGFLVVQGGALVVGGGNCPIGPAQAAWGDPVPFFELILPRRAAKAAIPVLAVVALAGIAAVALLPPGL